MAHQVVIIGMGRFGTSVAQELYRIGHDVLIVDQEPALAQQMMGQVTYAVSGDATSAELLEELGIEHFDTAVVAIGTDIIHQHPSANGAAIGQTSFCDFRLLTAIVSDLNNGGVVLNFGSAGILPEVFLKALTVARNLGNTVRHFTSANFDMIQQYRPQQNVVNRPTSDGGTGFSFCGHHEIMIPLFAAAVKSRLAS